MLYSVQCKVHNLFTVLAKLNSNVVNPKVDTAVLQTSNFKQTLQMNKIRFQTLPGE